MKLFQQILLLFAKAAPLFSSFTGFDLSFHWKTFTIKANENKEGLS